MRARHFAAHDDLQETKDVGECKVTLSTPFSTGGSKCKRPLNEQHEKGGAGSILTEWNLLKGARNKNMLLWNLWTQTKPARGKDIR